MSGIRPFSLSKQPPLILVADSDKSMRVLLRKALELEGYRVVEVSDGKQCLDAYQTVKPELVLLDAVMPVMDGFTCCKQLLQIARNNLISALATFDTNDIVISKIWERTPILMITALDDEESVNRAFEVGAMDYITKPIHWPVLRQRLRRLLQQAQVYKQLSAADLTGLYLKETNFSGQNLTGFNLRKANVAGADFRETNLTRVQALGTDFTGAKFTGACLEDWNINADTKLNNIDCQYVYMKSGNQERRPSIGEFAPGEFTKLFQKALETVDLIFRNGIDWQAFLTSFQKLQVECGGEELFIQAIENKNDGALIIRVNVPCDAKKAEIENYLKREYDLALVAVEEKYKFHLQAKDEQIAIYRQQSTDLTEIVKSMAKRPIQNIIEVTGTMTNNQGGLSVGGSVDGNFNNVQGDNNKVVQGDTTVIGDRNINTGGGNYNERIERDYIQGNYYAAGQPQSLAQAAAEIQQLLKQLEQTYPTTNTSQQMVVAAEAIKQIESNPSLKKRAINAVKEGGLAAFEKAIDNPAGAFIVGAIKGWQELEAKD